MGAVCHSLICSSSSNPSKHRLLKVNQGSTVEELLTYEAGIGAKPNFILLSPVCEGEKISSLSQALRPAMKEGSTASSLTGGDRARSSVDFDIEYDSTGCIW